MSVLKNEISNGAHGIFVKNSRFKTTLVAFNFYLPLKKENVAANALLPFVLTTCSKDYPTFRKLNTKLNKLYGAELTASAEKIGDYQLLKMAVSVISDKYALDGEVLTSEAIDLLTRLVFEPKINSKNAFYAEDVEREKRKAVEHIKGEYSEKRIYAKNRLIEEMFKDDVYGLPKCGTVEDVENVDGRRLYSAWKEMLETAFIRVNVISNTMPKGVFDAVSEKLSNIERKSVTDITKTLPALKAQKVTTVTENTDVNQGKLVMGFSVDGGNLEKNSAEVSVAVDIFGGGPYSKLFANVREKMSLCYYCAARCVKTKALVTVESGVEAKNAEKAQKAITEQLKMLQNGELTDTEFNSSILGLSDSLKTYNDSPEMLETWYSIRIADEALISPEDFAASINNVNKQSVINIAKGIKLHTVFYLLPEVKGK